MALLAPPEAEEKVNGKLPFISSEREREGVVTETSDWEGGTTGLTLLGTV